MTVHQKDQPMNYILEKLGTITVCICFILERQEY